MLVGCFTWCPSDQIQLIDELFFLRPSEVLFFLFLVAQALYVMKMNR